MDGSTIIWLRTTIKCTNPLVISFTYPGTARRTSNVLFAVKGFFLRGDITSGVMASTAVIAAIIVGEYAAAALVVFMMCVGEWLENFTVARTDNALRDLSRLVPAQVMVRRDGQEQVIALEQVVLGDTVLARTGERLGMDGVVTGSSASPTSTPKCWCR